MIRLRLAGLETRYLNAASVNPPTPSDHYTCGRCGLTRACNPTRKRPDTCRDCKVVLSLGSLSRTTGE